MEVGEEEKIIEVYNKKEKEPQKQKKRQKLEANKRKQEQRNEQINQKKEQFQNKKKQFQKEEKLPQKIEKSFHNNKSQFDTIFESSKYNLNVQVDFISNNILKPIKVNLSDNEIEIILRNENQLVIGRSGTGKTTTAVVKLTSMIMGYEQAQQDNLLSQSKENIRICFTAISNYLKLDVENLFLRIMNKPLPRAFSKPYALSQVKKWPHFTNIKELILQIDGNVAVPFIQRDAESKIIQVQNMEINLENRLIVKLKDEIEDDYQYSEVGIRQFVDEFWLSKKTKFDQINVDPYVAYSQINSYITGNQMSHKSDNNMISKEKYLNLIGKSKIGLDEEQKMGIYQICEQYQQWKYEKKYFDFNDIVNYIIKNILEGNYDSENGYFHYLFIDEVQDVNCACLYLLCLLTEQKVYLGGDTAQTISQENCFKFADLKAIFSENNIDKDYEVNQTLSSKLNESQLVQNFRSHGQIIELNNLIVRLLEIFFPTSLDHLKPEISLIKGPKPILTSNLKHLYKFLSQDQEVNENVDYFGRLQVYIVKDQDQKVKLKQILERDGKKGQILTVLESKGLEFQDVIAYNLLSSSYKSTKCWDVLNLLKISIEKIPIQVFQNNFHCQLQEEFKGSTFNREKGSDYVEMKTISKQQNAESQILKQYSKDFNKLINELKNIYVAFSRARSRIFIYEDEIFVGKQIKNPTIKLLEDLNITEDSQLNDEQIIKIMTYHQEYIQQNEPIKSNKQQFISMAEILIERQLFLDAAVYYEIIGDELNKKICIAKNLIIGAQRKIQDKNEQFEKEKIQMLQGQTEIKQSNLYQAIKKEMMEAIKNLQGSQEFELIAQIYFKLGMYNEAIQYYKYFKDLLQNSHDLNQDLSRIKEIDSNIKHIYFLNAKLLEQNSNKQKELELNYQQLESYIENNSIQDIKVQLYLPFRLSNYEKLLDNLIKFKQNNLIEKKELIHILHYYYPKILEQKLQQIMLININEDKKSLQEAQKALGEVLIELIQQVIIPFESEFITIVKSRQNKNFSQEQYKYFKLLSKKYCFKILDNEQKYINGKYLMLFYLMLAQFDCLKQQKKFNFIFQEQELSHQTFIYQLLQNRLKPQIIQNVLDEMKSLHWLQYGKKIKQISTHYQHYYVYLGLYDELKNRELIISSQDNNQYLNFTFQLKSFDKFQQLNSPYDQIYFIQRAIIQGQFKEKMMYQSQMIPGYKKISLLKGKTHSKYIFQHFKDLVYQISTIQTKQKKQGESHTQQFIKCQDLLISFFICLQNLQVQNMKLLNDERLIQFIDLARFFFSLNSEFFENSLYGELNCIFQDAFCSCFGFISPYIPGSNVLDPNFKHLWQLLGYNNYYLVNVDNPYLDESIVKKDKLISPILSPEFSKIKIIEKKTAIMLSKKQFGQYCTKFLKEYSQLIINEINKSTYFMLDPIKKISLSFQILYLNYFLKKYIQNNDEKIFILKQNIPKNYTREYKIKQIKNLIQKIEKDDYNNQNVLQIQNLKILLDKKEKSQMKYNEQKTITIKDTWLLEDIEKKIKINTIQQGLVYRQQNKNSLLGNSLQQYLQDEISNILASILNKITPIDQSFEYLKNVLADKKAKYIKQYNQIIQKAENQIKNDNNLMKTGEQTLSENKLYHFVESKNLIQQGQMQDKKIKAEEIISYGQNIIQSCDDILYAFTIFNMSNSIEIITELFVSCENNKLVQFAQMCYKFFKSINTFDQINIGLLSNQLLLTFRASINEDTQINLFKIGLAEVYILLNMAQSSGEKKQLCIPSGFENCFSFKQDDKTLQIQVFTAGSQVNYENIYLYIKEILDLATILKLKTEEEIPIFNMVLQILILFLNKETKILNQNEFVQKIYAFLDYFLIKIQFLKQFHKTFYNLIKQATNSYNSADQKEETVKELIKFIQEIKYAEISQVLIQNYSKTQDIYCVINIQMQKKRTKFQQKYISKQSQQTKSQISGMINFQDKKIVGDSKEQKYINLLYKQDFVIFMNQIVFYQQKHDILFKQEIQQKLQLFEEKFLKASNKIQMVRKIFLQELSKNNFQSSERYIYIITTLNSIVKKEKEFYDQMIETQKSIIEEQFHQKLDQHTTEFVNQMEKEYLDYLNYFTDQSEQIEKESLDVQKFIEEQINFKN